VIGRREAAAGATTDVRRRLLEQRNIALHSYDWLLEAVDAPPAGRAGGPLDWPDWTARI
jgi:hypothetical protein